MRVREASTGAAELHAEVGNVRVEVAFEGTTEPERTLFHLARRDDPDWRPTLLAPQAPSDAPMLLTDEAGVLKLHDLGWGTYVLAPADSERWSAFEFTIPGPPEVQATFSPR